MFGLNPYRKKMFVSGRIQGRLMFRIGLYWVLYHVVLWHALFVYRYIQYRMSGALGTTAVPFQELYGQFVIDYYPLILCAVITLPIVVIDMLHMTHRVAGPLVAFTNALRNLIAGKEVQSVKLRKGDLLTDFQEEFNEYLAVLAAQREQAAANGSSDEDTDKLTESEAAVLQQVSELRDTVREAVVASETTAHESEPETQST